LVENTISNVANHLTHEWYPGLPLNPFSYLCLLLEIAFSIVWNWTRKMLEPGVKGEWVVGDQKNLVVIWPIVE